MSPLVAWQSVTRLPVPAPGNMLSLHRAWKPAILPSGARAGRDLPHIREPHAFCRSYQSFADASGARLREGAMRRSTDRLIALQFLAVAVPIAFVLLAQMAADARRAAALEQSRPLRTLANEARANYRTFTNGAADAVDTGALGRQSAEALNTTAALLARLAERGEAAALGDTPRQVADLAAQVASGATLERLMALRPQIAGADHETRAIDESFERRDAAVVEDAVESARVRQLEADAAIERRRRAELETVEIRFRVATRAARAGVYEMDESGGTVWWSDTMNELYGVSAGNFQPTLSGWLELIHPADRDGARAAMTAAMGERKPLRTQYRAVRPDGSIAHLESVAAVVGDPAGEGVRMVGIDLDVTERVAAQRREDLLQQQLRDASRQAGMADVATSVLHNVGNVLNSVNVSANLVADSLKRSRAAGLTRVVALLEEHQGDLGSFVAHDARGKVLPVYLAELSRHLSADNSNALQELDALRGNIDHIKDIVTMQQRYAKLGGAAEPIDVGRLVEESLRINASAFERHAIEVVRQFADVPQITVDKHKVLQILVNLLRNAKDACDAAGERERRVTLSVERCATGVRVAVADNGVGIAAEHMSRVFTHGFTTKKTGHGFGLHSGALAAKEMGGVLRVESPGLGCGATFVVELPLGPPGNAHG
ncbi:MAG: PAS domain S-box protein [Gammaproteobacteria bacterium]|nr:MAG: PAS domain S-box protein [Gammaproteobacteria bacterium]